MLTDHRNKGYGLLILWASSGLCLFEVVFRGLRLAQKDNYSQLDLVLIQVRELEPAVVFELTMWCYNRPCNVLSDTLPIGWELSA